MPISTNADDLFQKLSSIAKELKSAQSLVDGWTRSGGTTPNFEFLRATNAEFVVSPLEVALFETASTQTIGQWTPIVFHNIVFNNGPWEYSTAGSAFTHGRPPLAESYWFFGRAEFNDPSSGEVGIRFVRSGFTNGAPSTQYDPVAFCKATNSNDKSVVPISYPLRANSSATGFYWEAYQDASPTFELSAVSLGVIRVARL